MSREQPQASPASAANPVREVERRLGLKEADRGELPGLYELNAVRVPRMRLVSAQLILAFAVLHNTLLPAVAPPWSPFAWVALGIEAYAVMQFFVLRRYYARLADWDLGTVFTIADLLLFTAVVWATGAHRSLMWPVYLLRVADQMWTGRRRAAFFGVLGVACYVGLLLWMAWIQGAPVDVWPAVLRVAVLLVSTGYLVAASGLPWDLRDRTLAAKQAILSLEDQRRELDDELARARRASHAKTLFLSRVRRELRTPVHTILGLVDLVLGKGTEPLAESDLENLRRVRKNGEHLGDLLTEILDIAGIEEGRLALHAGEVDLEALVRRTVREVEERYGRPGVRVFVAFPRNLEPLKADEARLRQVLTNLIGNALKFTGEGWIRVEVRAAPESAVPAEIRVVDTGPGLDPDQIAALLDPEQDPDASGGSTLGLSVSRTLCEFMGFRLSAESGPDQGATFVVRLTGDAG